MAEKTDTEAVAVIETRLTHNFHRRATTLLAEAAARPPVPLSAVATLRDFLVAALHHHHEAEDEQLWPLITEVAPQAAAALAGLSEEHDRLDAALDRLEALPLDQDSDRSAAHDAAAEVRKLIHSHLDREEPLLFPVLRGQFPPASWTAFSQQVLATAPPIAPHLMIGFFNEVGTADEVALILSGLPEPVQDLVPVLGQQGRSALAVLSGAGGH